MEKREAITVDTRMVFFVPLIGHVPQRLMKYSAIEGIVR